MVFGRQWSDPVSVVPELNPKAVFRRAHSTGIVTRSAIASRSVKEVQKIFS